MLLPLQAVGPVLILHVMQHTLLEVNKLQT